MQSADHAAITAPMTQSATEITFRLPGIRIEHVTTGPRTVVGLTAVTFENPVPETTLHWHS